MGSVRPWAAFVSVLVQRRDPVRDRLRDNRLGYATPSGESARTDREGTRFVVDRLEEVDLLVGRLESFMLSPAFRELLQQCADDNVADADDILHTANRLMDFHDQFLQLVERSRGLTVPRITRNCCAIARGWSTCR